MINFREIFNPSYNWIGIVIILLLVVFLFFLERDRGDFFANIGLVGIRTGIIMLVLGFVVMLILKFLPHSYRIFVEVISDNIVKSILSGAVLILVIGFISYMIAVVMEKRVNEKSS